MEKIKIQGDHSLRLRGKVRISGSKNAVLPAIAASLLTEERLRLDNIPRVKDVFTILTLMEELGAHSKLKDNSLS
ncbi:MAG: UDP-N-acetylglucosamine 1-carboxyvinyltransferase, partial [Candidatus Aminicenantes bacterium]|nr:UDP-N-acetylglucosamine 1-carboxyvinyltransferase [Candidatus Aminicenantes bacterium]